MGGVVFVISAQYAEHWTRALSAGFWETERHISVETGDLFVFWLAGEKKLLGVAQAVAPTEPTDYSSVDRPWLASDPTTYNHRYPFELVDTTGDPSLRWTDLMSLVGQNPKRGANTAPVQFDSAGALALADHLHAGANASVPEPAVLSPDTPFTKPFVKRIDYTAPATVTISVHDPDAWGAGLSTHRQTENLTAAFLTENGFTPHDPTVGGPNFDLAWYVNDILVVCEVKSITPANERGQIRLGLGQVLDYAFVLSAAGHTVEPWLIVDHEPSSAHWVDLCAANGVTLCWPAVIGKKLADP